MDIVPAEQPTSHPVDDKPALPEISSDEPDEPDEPDVGWGDDPESGRRDEDWYRRERPPHHE
ncbi:MAG: hypothetical protein M3070_00525 [Actinomycetota bacterium]|nr:hypothetical protein [Actinomycetota bacterium]